MGYKTGGRQLGTPNKGLNDSRKAITALIEGNIDKLSEWLDTVASGVLKVDIETGKQTHEYLVRPNPAKAFDMFMSAVEYAIPKLARTEIVAEAIDSEEANERAQVFFDLIDEFKRKRQEEI